MAKFRGTQISDRTIQSVHLVSGITVNSITLSGNQAGQKTFSLVKNLGLRGQNVSYNLDNFLAITGGTVTGAVTVVGGITGSSTISIPSGAALSVSGALTGGDLLQALAGVHASVTAESLKRLTDDSVLTTEHTHNFSALGGRSEHELVKVATQSADTITLDYGNFALISIPNVSTLKSSDIEAFINGQLLEYGSPNGFTLNSTNGTVTFHPSISGDTLSVVWRGLDTTASGVVVSYEPVSYPYPTGGGIETTAGLFANGGSPGDLYGSWSAPTSSDGQPDIHMKLVVSGVAGISRIDVKKDSTVVASTASGTGVPIFVFTANIQRTFPLTLDASGTFVFDLYFTTPSGVTSGNLLTATYTPITGSAVDLPGTGLPSSSTSPLGPLVSVSDIYQNVDKTIANISLTSFVTKWGNINAPFSGDVYLAGIDETLPNLSNLPSWLSSQDLNASDWIKLKIKNFSANTLYEYFELKILHPTLDSRFSYEEKSTQLSFFSGIVASIGGVATRSSSDILTALKTGVTKPVFYVRKYLNSAPYDLTQAGRVFFDLTTSTIASINGTPINNAVFLVAQGASYLNLPTIHFNDPYRIQSDYTIPSPLGAHEHTAPSMDFATIRPLKAGLESPAPSMDFATVRPLKAELDSPAPSMDFATTRPLNAVDSVVPESDFGTKL